MNGNGSGGGGGGGMAGVVGVLKVNGRIPRRAVVLPDGTLSDKLVHPDQSEVEVLSRLCELARRHGKQPCYPRHAAMLLEEALSTNAGGAWEAVRDDVMTGDMDLDGAAAVLRHSSNCMALVSCVVGARDDKHVTSLVIFMAAVLPTLCDETRAELGTVLGYQLHAVMDTFVKNGALMTRDVRDGLLSGFGKVLASCGLAETRVADMVEYALASKRDELLRLFLHMPSGFIHARPALVGTMLDRARTVPVCNRYPLLAMLAKLMADGVVKPTANAANAANAADAANAANAADAANAANTTIVIECDGAKVHDVVVSSLSGDGAMDSRMCLAIGTLVGAWGAAAVTPLAASLARALTACSMALVQGVQSSSSQPCKGHAPTPHQASQHAKHSAQLDDRSKRPRV